ncbi:MAG TPA: PBP1A family penicillin-binding protein [Candidatus Hydrogenedentes bacterium]|nr:PBP1A family penicillin-binding protein [Candidatus Hydrogenedentota bacterium]
MVGGTRDRGGRAGIVPRRGCAGIFFCIMVVLAAIWGALLGAFVWVLESEDAAIAALDDFRPRIGSKVYSSDGVLLGEFTTAEARQLVGLSEMPLHLQKAFLATEDHKFYEHKGVRPEAFLSAFFDMLRTGRVRGASTITMQLVRNVPVTGVSKEQTIRRKLKESILALRLEREFTKDEILELYLNQIFFGGSAWGVEAAAQQYYGKPCRGLTLDQCALLAGIVRRPNDLRPDLHPEAAERVRNVVLKQMLDEKNGFITQEEYESAVATPVQDAVLTPEKRAAMAAGGTDKWRPNKFLAPYFVEQVRRIIRDDLTTKKEEVFEGGLTIHTTVDMRLQRAAEEALFAGLDAFDEERLEYLKRHNRDDEFIPVSGALVCLDNRRGFEGYVRAMVGGRDFDKQKFNLATQARRQPGSSVKPFVWAAAIDQRRHTAADMVLDEPFERLDGAGQPWSPENFKGTYYGQITLRFALEKSVNVISVKLVEELTMPMVRSYMQSAGIRSPIDDEVGLTIGLGTSEVTVIEHCAAYATFANGGAYCEPMYIADIKNRDGFSQYKGVVRKNPGALPEDVAYVLTYLLQGVAEHGTGARSKALDRPRAGKTGTTNDSRDVWFCGFTPQFTCVVWMGYEDFRPLGKGDRYTGGRLACPIWTEFMVKAHEGLPKLDFPVPAGVYFEGIDRDTGLRGGDFKEVFLMGTEPPTELAVFEIEERFDDLSVSVFPEGL